MNLLKLLLSKGVRSRVFSGLIVLVLGAFTLLPSVPAQAASSGTWRLTGSLHVAREDATATLLLSGQVLVVGSESSNAELYNPSTGAWTLTGSLHAARDQHTATLFANGQVLVAGGQNGTIFIASAEVYHPSTGTWTTTGSLHTPRVEHTATLLPNGQVLVAGGLDSNYNYLASAELFTP